VRRPSGPALAAWLVLSALANWPYLKAATDVPPGRAFVGFFYYIDDSYNYLSYVQQAEDGAWVFRDKMAPGDQAAAVVNVEWWLVGRLSALLGRRPALAYRLFGLAIALALVVAVDASLAARGITAARRLPGLLLVFTGAGLGGLLLRAGVPGGRCLDLTTGLFPFVETLANPHFATGTLLLLLALLAFARGRPVAGIAWGTVLGLVRPYEVGLLVAARGLGVALTERPARWPRALLPLLGLAPVFAYNYWVFLREARRATFASATYASPPLLDFLPALGPAILLAAWVWRPAPGPPSRVTELHLAAWAATVLFIVAARPVPFYLQFIVGVGLPILALAAAGLASRALAWSWVAAGAFCSTAVVALMLVGRANPRWHVPRERMDAALVLRPSCAPGDLALTPPDVGLYTAGLTACRVYVGHAAASGFAQRDEEARAFYGAAAPAWRTALLDRVGVTRLVLPGEAADPPEAWLGAGTPFRLIGRTGQGPGAIGVFARVPARP
jgi:hypothetical protein